jgi:hypothetical protein
MEHLERLYSHPSARTLVARVGRGGTKSHVSTKVSLNEVLFGDWKIPPGEVHFWACASINKDEAAQRLQLIERFLLDLGEEYDRDGDAIVLPSRRLGWRVFACQIGAVSGFRCIGFTADELTKWRSADRLANPAGEVCASLNAMTVTHPRARRLLVSSPLGMVDYHYKRFALGDTEQQLTCSAPTWVANPSVTEEQTHELEPDERVWAREYAAIPQAGALAVFEPDAVARAFQALPSPAVGGRRVGIIDASSGKSDTWSWAVCGWRLVEGKPRLVFERVDGFEGSFWRQLSGDAVVASISDSFKAAGVHTVHGDQRESLMIRSAFRRHGLRFVEHPWTAPNKERAVSTVRRWLADNLLSLPEHEELRDELLMFEERTTTSGGFTFGARGEFHDDYVALLLTAAIADAAKQLPGSPSAKPAMLQALENLSPGRLELMMERA